MLKPKKTIKNITPYSIDDYRLNYEYKLDSNENFYGCPDFILKALKEIEKQNISLYPCYGELLDKLKQRYCKENILLTNGVDEALNLIINTYMEKNDEILSFSPTFSMPQIYANIVGAKAKTISYDEKFVFDKQKLEKNIKRKTKIIYIATPNNPTGDIVNPDDIDYLAKKFNDKLFIVDCTYINFSNSYQFDQYLNLLNENSNVAVLKSFSKDFSLAGLRLGFICSSFEIINNLKKVASPYNVNMVAIYLAVKTLENEKYFDEIKEKITNSKKELFDGLKKLNYEPFESEGNFILCDFKNHKDFVFEKLKKNGILTRSYSKNSNLSTYLRITIPDSDGVKKILQILSHKKTFVFDMDGVIFDVSNSYRQAIIKTFEHFTGYQCKDEHIQMVKNQGGMSNDWKVTKCLINQAGKNPSYEEIVEVFQNLFYNPNNEQKGLIDNEKVVFDKEFFEKLSKDVNLAIFTSRPKEEAFYSLEKAGIKEYFDYFICQEDVGKFPKPSGFGLNLIKQNCGFDEIYYFGDTIDDIKAGLEANVKVFGVIPPNATKVNETIQSLLNNGAYDIIKSKEDILNLKKESVCL